MSIPNCRSTTPNTSWIACALAEPNDRAPAAPIEKWTSIRETVATLRRDRNLRRLVVLILFFCVGLVTIPHYQAFARKQLGSEARDLVFMVITQEYPALRNAQRYFSYLMRMGFSQDQIKVVVNRYSKKTGPNYASLEQIQQTLNQNVFFGIPDAPAILASINKARPMVANREAAGELDKVFRSFVDKATGVKKAAATGNCAKKSMKNGR